MTVSYPAPLYANVDINSTYYSPTRFDISAISLGATTTVTTTEDHNFTIGMQAKLIIPEDYGSRQLNQTFGYVLSLPADDQVEIAINSNESAAFTNPETSTSAQIIAIGDINLGAINSSGITSQQTYINGSFINISPN